MFLIKRSGWGSQAQRITYQVVMGKEWDSGWINGVEMSHFVSPSLPYLPFLHLRKLGWRMFGTRMVMGVDGPPFFSRAFNAWELELVTHFLQKIQAFRVEKFIKVSCLSGWKLALHLKVKCLSLRHTTFWKKKLRTLWTCALTKSKNPDKLRKLKKKNQ